MKARAALRTPNFGVQFSSPYQRSIMPDWPHSPVHRLSSAGAFTATAATHGKAAIFSSRARLDELQCQLLLLAEHYSAALQAWAIFPNHYHFVAELSDPKELLASICHLHLLTARQMNELDGTMGRKVWFQYWNCDYPLRDPTSRGCDTCTRTRFITGLFPLPRIILGARLAVRNVRGTFVSKDDFEFSMRCH